MEEILERIKLLSEKEPKNLVQKALKLAEETGEVAQAVLSMEGASGCLYKELTKYNVAEECIDVCIVAAAILYQLKLDEEDKKFINEIIDRKLTKWEEKMFNKQ